MQKPVYIVRNIDRVSSGFKSPILEFLADLQNRNFARSSIEAYTTPLIPFVLFLNENGIQRFQDVTLEDAEAYRLHLKNRKLKPNSIEVYLRAVKVFFKYLEKHSHIFSNPVKELEVPNPKGQLPDVPTVEEMARLLAAPDVTTVLGIRDRAMLEVLYSTGVRRGELLAMTIFSVDLQNGTVRVFGKFRKERIVPLGNQAVYWLKKYISESRPVILKERNFNALWITYYKTCNMREGNVLQTLKRYCDKMKIRRICAHAIRRACVTHMLANGAHPAHLQHLLGHETLATLSEYLKITITDLKAMHHKSKLGK